MAEQREAENICTAPLRGWGVLWLSSTLAYYLLARAGLLASSPGAALLPLWPATGLGLGLTLLFGVRFVPGLAAGGLIATFEAVLAHTAMGSAGALALSFALVAAGVLEILSGHAAMRALAAGWPFNRVKDAGLFVLVVLCTALLGAGLGSVALAAAGLAPLQAVPMTFLTWWLGDSTSMLIFVPALLGIASRQLRTAFVVRLGELALLLAILAAFSLLFLGHSQPTLGGAASALVLPVLLWCAFRFGAWETSLAVALVGIFGMMGAMEGVGPFGYGAPGEAVFRLQAFLGLAAAMMLLVAAAVTHRRAAEKSLRALNETLEDQVEERTGSLIRSNLELSREVAERRKMEAALRESETRFRDLVENLPQTVYEIDLSGRFTFVNRNGLAMFGYAREDLESGLNVFETIHPGDRVRAREDFARQVGGVETEGQEYRCVRKDGQILPVRVYSHVIYRGGSPAGSRGLAFDVTDIRRAERDLIEKEERYRTLLEMMPQALVIYQSEGLALANQAAAETFGFPGPEAMLGIDPFAHIAEEERERVRDFVRRRTAGDPTVPRRYETVMLRVDGSRFNAEVSGKVIEYRGALANQVLISDVTERTRAERLLQQSHDELELQVEERTRELTVANRRLTELNSLKTAFLSSASHELRTPLTSILGFARMIGKIFSRHFMPLAEKDPQLAHRAQMIMEDAQIIVNEGHRLTRLVNDLLDLNKIESGRMEWRDEDLDMPALLARMAQAVSGTAEARPEISLRTAVPDDLPAVRADRDRVEQVVLNLLGNALKFTAQGWVELSAQATDGMVEVRITDTGPGVPETERERIFQKFYQMDDGDRDRDKPKGTGLGLAICRQIAEHYGGSVRMEPDDAGGGASFVFCLPAREGGGAQSGVP